MITNINEIPKNISGIYIINYDNGKIYIGQAMNIRNRALEHNSKNKDICDKALKKHNATISILEKINDLVLLDDIEKLYIKRYSATDRNVGYNILKYGNVSGKRGLDNYNAVFNETELNEIIDLLLNHKEISIKDIAKQYNVHQTTILRISKGQSYVNPNLSYPLRENDHSNVAKNQVLDYFSSEEQLINLKEDLKYRWDLSIDKDLKEKYQIPLRILREINNGRKFTDVGIYEYPIRGKNIRNIHNFSQTDIKDILNDLSNTQLSMQSIGLKYNLNRTTVSNINQGLSYPIKDYQYPARK